MARNEIADKLTILLSDLEWSEPNVVYLFVQVRKLLDHRRNTSGDDLPNLRFYCDWVVHISKDRIDNSTLKILGDLIVDIEAQVKSPYQETGKGPINFAYFEHLKPELQTLLQEEDIPVDMLRGYNRWTALISHLVKVLENQPLVVSPSHGLNISEIVFRPSNPGTVIMVVRFVNPIKGYDGKDLYFFRLLNAY